MANVKPLHYIPPPPTTTASDEFNCPITYDIMEDPVVASDGHTYERTAIERWLAEKRTSPICGAIPSLEVYPNHSLKKRIIEFQECITNYVWVSPDQEVVVANNPALTELVTKHGGIPCWVPGNDLARAMGHDPRGVARIAKTAEAKYGKKQFLTPTELEIEYSQRATWNCPEHKVAWDGKMFSHSAQLFETLKREHPTNGLADHVNKVVRAKLDADRKIKPLLLATGDIPIIMIKKNELGMSAETGNGQNLLGEAWMEVRKELQDDEGSAKRQKTGD